VAACFSEIPPLSCLDLLRGFEHDLRTAPDVLELLKGKEPKDIAAAVQQLFQNGQYVSFTILMDAATTALAAFIIDTRKAETPKEWWGPHTDQVVDLHNTTIIFLGKHAKYTAPHGDWADAHNIAFAVAALKVCMAVHLPIGPYHLIKLSH